MCILQLLMLLLLPTADLLLLDVNIHDLHYLCGDSECVSLVSSTWPVKCAVATVTFSCHCSHVKE